MNNMEKLKNKWKILKFKHKKVQFNCKICMKK